MHLAKMWATWDIDPLVPGGHAPYIRKSPKISKHSHVTPHLQDNFILIKKKVVGRLKKV